MAALCTSSLLHLCLKPVSDDGVLQAEKSGLGCLHGGIQNKSMFEMEPILCFTLAVCTNDAPLPSQSIIGISLKPFNIRKLLNIMLV